MIITKLQGGLGNQLFQYALGRFLARKTSSQLKFDLTEYSEDNGNTRRGYRLDRFNVVGEIATQGEVDKLAKYKRKPGKLWYVRNALFADNARYVTEKTLAFDPSALAIAPPALLDGFWQSERYFADIAGSIREEITLRHPLNEYYAGIEREISAVPEPTSMHVRRGDYVSNASANKAHGVCSADYYRSAFEKLGSLRTNPTAFVFSDDIAWVREHIPIPFPCVFVSLGSGGDECQELVLMSKCRNHIIANSSFSWWGAWLSSSPDKLVFAPRKWFAKDSWNTPDRLPESWHTL